MERSVVTASSSPARGRKRAQSSPMPSSTLDLLFVEVKIPADLARIVLSSASSPAACSLAGFGRDIRGRAIDEAYRAIRRVQDRKPSRSFKLFLREWLRFRMNLISIDLQLPLSDPVTS